MTTQSPVVGPSTFTPVKHFSVSWLRGKSNQWARSATCRETHLQS